MQCQYCHQNPATIHLQMNFNGQRIQIDLCQNCYQKLQNLQTDMMNGGNGMNNFGFGSLEDFMNAMNNMQSQAAGANGQNMNGQSQRQGGGRNRKGILGQYGINLTDLARQGKIDPVIGRDNEIKRVIEILNRRTKNNPVLIGEAGVGKTAVVEGLAQAIVSGQVPEKLANKEIIRLDVVSLVQGTGIRGQFEKRMQQLMEEVRKNKNIILFIDEIHEIMGAGNAEGGMDAGNVLKPALARGDFQLVGATTLNEYRKIEKDAALARRFQPVEVDEPSVEETIHILNGIKNRYQDYHHVKYTDDAIVAAAKLSDRYIQDRYLPDKAIDLLDEAGSKKNLTLKNVDPNAIENEIHTAEAHKQQAADNQDYEKAAFYRDQVAKLEKAKKEAEENHTEDSATVTVKDMQRIVEERTNIPVGDLQKQEENQLRDLDKKLDEHVIGQTQAVDKVARAIRRNRIGLNKSGRPIGSFLFVGPTGVGKTETAKQLALQLFGSKDAMIRFDMSEYMDKTSTSKLIGAAPGYVGYEEAGQLTEQVRWHPYSLILLDEVEKAHPDVMHMFLQILDDGRLTDSQGRTVSFKDTIIIMTSNAGTGDSEASVGFGAESNGSTHSIIDKLTNYFKPEFLNRFDDIVQFNALSKDDLMKIVNLMIDDVNNMLADKNLHIEVTNNVEEKLVDMGFDPKMGARPLRRVIQEQIEDRIADYVLDHSDAHKLVAKLDDNGDIVVEETEEVPTIAKK
ncbi:ATP-dependent Clp protease ATP-binding subunit [Limosilactobacillus reuteri]|uniref:ATP-dependent Clp protease ATP-binding subunit n=1 Tax=Limosilactobacillus reuteri TaxID=1598 RepID=UPI00081C0C79|nr:ATP-dependent Clp protease ATP-binding subunit [Limosilactobacillus reuteri]MCH5380137.1 AAA family ATPase [Limosilactobacillus reuteri]OCW61380.1 ATP-dependent Clp protease ATP-binding subunit [Limosilactobacillus reuteri]OCW66938.1 ATP-dependent Clp protease ATP-binding subunit [Limosilactobacillus reuteri]OCW66959.1 ATP-dependent Clp protease ATP-binding subunit [Limosilactobacillus reuteri]OCW68578.1 ATP-dependent Clp protease ATP-binding subunit [Limosilactobacillus reuteri]